MESIFILYYDPSLLWCLNKTEMKPCCMLNFEQLLTLSWIFDETALTIKRLFNPQPKNNLLYTYYAHYRWFLLSSSRIARLILWLLGSLTLFSWDVMLVDFKYTNVQLKLIRLQWICYYFDSNEYAHWLAKVKILWMLDIL